MHHGVDVGLREHVRDQWVTDIGPHELSASQLGEPVGRRRCGVDADDALYRWVGRQPGRQASTEDTG